MVRSKRVLVRCCGLVITLFFLLPAVGFAWHLGITVDYEDTNADGCPDVIEIEDKDESWRKGVPLFKTRPKVQWVEDKAIAADRAEWELTWNPGKNNRTEYAHLPAKVKIDAGKDESEKYKSIHAWAPVGAPWYWSYDVRVQWAANSPLKDCPAVTKDPEIVFRGGDRFRGFLSFVLTVFLLFTIGGAGYYFGHRKTD